MFTFNIDNHLEYRPPISPTFQTGHLAQKHLICNIRFSEQLSINRIGLIGSIKSDHVNASLGMIHYMLPMNQAFEKTTHVKQRYQRLIDIDVNIC